LNITGEDTTMVGMKRNIHERSIVLSQECQGLVWVST
jgi:hypothetical protein